MILAKRHPHSDVNGLQQVKRRATEETDPTYFFIKEFAEEGADETFMAAMPLAPPQANPKTPPSGLPAYLNHLWQMQVLSPEQEQHCFKQLNYLKFLLDRSKQNSKFAADQAQKDQARNTEELKALQESIDQVRNFLIESNLRLVVSIAKRHATPSSESFEELVCVGNEALMRAIEGFDFRRGTRLSTYAYQAIERSIYGLYRRENRLRAKLVVNGENCLASCDGDAGESDRTEFEANEAKEQVYELMQSLDDRDRRIVMARFGIGRSTGGAAFHVIADEIKLSTTRTVQLFNRCLERMRQAASRRTVVVD